jgi:hypothetical protein
LLKLEIGVKDTEMRADEIVYELHVTIRLVKITYVDPKSVAVIGEQPFYRLPLFEKFVLSKIYDQTPSGDCIKPIPYLKVKNITTGQSDIV